MSHLVLHGHVVTESSFLENAYLTVHDGVIENISTDEPDPNYPRLEMNEDSLILPGFRDPHTHDINGQLVSSSRTETKNSERLETVLRAYAANGVTSVYIATFGAPLEELEHYCRSAKRWMDEDENGKHGTKLSGINIEGSFLNEECRGAQPAEYCFIPGRMDCIDAVSRLYATGAVRMVNIVPDYGKASLETIKHARSLGIMVGSGHLKPEAQLLRRAFDGCGLQYMVHFTNGPTGQSFKPFGGGNAFEGAMDLPIRKELILDLTHIDRRYVLDMIKRNDERWGDSKIIAITDASFPLDDEIPEGEFQIGTTVAEKDDEYNCLRAVAYIQPDGTRLASPPNTLCGSILKMNQAFANLVQLFMEEIEGIWYHHYPHTFDQAVVKAAKLCAMNQAKLDGSILTHGSIDIEKHADLVIGNLQRADHQYQFDVHKTMIDGRAVYSS